MENMVLLAFGIPWLLVALLRIRWTQRLLISLACFPGKMAREGRGRVGPSAGEAN